MSSNATEHPRTHADRLGAARLLSPMIWTDSDYLAGGKPVFNP
jgi:hypothetical protein